MAAFRLSNNVIGALNLVTLLLSAPILGGGVWMATRGDGSECDRHLSSPAIALGAVLMAVSLAGLVGACCRVTWLLWVYLLAMFALIVLLLGFTAFAFAVTNKGAGEAVSGRGYREYRLGDYSTWLQRRVESSKNWDKIRSCLAGAGVCGSLQGRNETWAQFVAADLSPVQSGCCKPPTSCNFTYGGGTRWGKTARMGSADPDCDEWSNDADELCFGCQSCKAGVVATLKKDWNRVAIVNVVFPSFIVVVYFVGCCAFKNSRRDSVYRRAGGWKQAGYA
uniref:Tetraspanin n=1 Tax=Oryza brachyantha TaxID=4533 RepID=J3MTF7_ORYBR